MKRGSVIYFGTETELAVYAEGGELTEARAAERLIVAVLDRFPNVSDGSRGGFLGNGSRLYLDAVSGTQCHLEFATAEIGSIEELIAHWESFCHMLAAVGGEQGEGPPLLVSSRTYDFANRVAFGSHENYSICPPRAESMIPFLASRIFCGGGGLDPFRPGIHFLVSPRAAFTHCVSSSATQEGRGIWDQLNITRARPSGNSERFHMHCSDGQRSPCSLYLRLGTTALVAAAIEAGFSLPLAEVELKDPLAAYKLFSADPTCRAVVPLKKGSRMVSAIEIQRRYLAFVESAIARGSLPEWAPTVCDRWRSVLDQLEDDPAKLGDRLDWAIKYRLISRQIQRSGFGSWQTVEKINAVMAELEAMLEEQAGAGARLTSRTLSELNPNWVREIWRRSCVPSDGDDRAELARRFLMLKESLVALDYRYNEFGAESLFNRLEKSGTIKPRFPGLAPAPEGDLYALKVPSGGRARYRARLVAKHGKKGLGGQLECHWHYLEGPGVRFDFPDADVDPQVKVPDCWEGWERCEPVSSGEGGGR